MARQVINIGVNKDDGSGDKIRDAMIKVNANFVELYSQTSSETNIEFNSGEISITNTNGNLALTPNGTGKLLVSSGSVFNTNGEPQGTLTALDIDGAAMLTVNPQFKNVGINTTATTKGLSVLGTTVLTTETTSDSIQLLGNVQLGNDSTNSVSVTGSINSNIVPLIDNQYSLGSSSKRYNTVFAANVVSNLANITTGTLTTLNATNARVTGDTTMGNLVVRNNQISNSILNQDIQLNPYGTGNVFVNTKLVIGSGSTTMVNPILQATGSANNFTQIGVQNTNSGKFACSDIVVFNDQGSDFYNFIDLGQNNTGWDGSLQYIYFTNASPVTTWQVGDVVRQLDPADGVSILASGIIDENIINPLNASQRRIRVSQVYTGTTGIFEQSSVAGNVTNVTASNSAAPLSHVMETITSDGQATYLLGTHTLNGSTAMSAFGPTVVMSAQSVEVKVNGVKKTAGIDYTIEYNRIRFYSVPAIGATITIRQYPDANYPFTIGQDSDSYLYTNGAQLSIGTMTGNDVVFHTNGSRFTAEAGRIKGDTKNWIIGKGITSNAGPTDSGDTLQVNGSVKVTGNVKITSRTISTSIGASGDKAGMVAFDNSYIYRCTADYDGVTNVWKRVAWSGSTW